MIKMTKTNVMRILDSSKIPYTVLEYEVNEEDLSGASTAQKTGIPPEQMFKTLVTVKEKGAYRVFCIPVEEELDLKKAARASGDKKLEMMHVKDLKAVTGYIRGGCSPIGMKKLFPTFVDETAILFDEIYVSAGVRGAMVGVNVEEIITLTDGKICDLTK